MKTVDDLQKELRKLLQREGAVLVGFADLKQVADAVLPVGISVGIPLPVQIVEMVKKYPTQAYYDTYLAYNHQLDHIVSAGESLLTSG